MSDSIIAHETNLLVAEITAKRDEAIKELRKLVTACERHGFAASMSHPRYTRQLSAARKFLENDSNPATDAS